MKAGTPINADNLIDVQIYIQHIHNGNRVKIVNRCNGIIVMILIIYYSFSWTGKFTDSLPSERNVIDHTRCCGVLNNNPKPHEKWLSHKHTNTLTVKCRPIKI